MQNDSEINWTQVIKPVSGWFNFNLKEVWDYRDLIRLFFKRDFVTFYKQTILGPLWFLIQPLLTTIVFTVVFGQIAKLSTDGSPQILFYMSGTILWSFFSQSVTNSSNTFIQNANIFGKVYFPRLVMPISNVFFNFFTMLIQLLMFSGFWIYYYSKGANIALSNYVFLFPLLFFQLALLGLGMGIIISSLTTKYRDLALTVGFGLQLWMYATPIVYPLSTIPGKYQWFYFLNPVTMIIEIFRIGVLGHGFFAIDKYILSIAVTIFLFLFGVVLFSRVEKTFIDKV
jgi:lipopolysaccharide transport system permease protein